MTLPQAKKLILFAHIPKTAGMTFWTIIKQNYQTPNCYYYDIRRDLDKTARTINQSTEIEIAMGHFGFGFHHLLNQPHTYLTMLREPIQRTISDYYYYQQSEMAINKYNPPLTWEEFCPRMANNIMTRFYAGIEFACIKKFNSFAKLRVAKIQNSSKLKDYYNHSPAELLTLAKNNLKENFDYIGIVERFDESLLLLKQKFNWKHLNYVQRNIGHKKIEKMNLDQEKINYITKYNQLDIELYKYARKLFNEQIDKQDKIFTQELRALQKSNQRYCRLINSGKIQSRLLDNLPAGL